jgi:hypothetical protein
MRLPTRLRRLPIPLPRSVRWVVLALCALVPALPAQGISELPFAPGERFTYAGRVHTGIAGRGTLWVEAPSELRGTTIWVLHSDMEGRVGPLRATDRSASWLDPVRMTTLRYTTRERHLLSRHDNATDIFAGEGRWSDAEGASGELAAPDPLDELSFLYFLRTMPFSSDSTISVIRHFDPARNPTTLRVIGREDVKVGAGRFRALIVEMRVRDARRYRGEGIIRVSLSDDRCRLILRLESTVPDAGTATLSLQSYDGMRWPCGALAGR